MLAPSGFPEETTPPPVHSDGQPGQLPSVGEYTKPDGLAHLRSVAESKGVPREVIDFTEEAWAEGTRKQYQSAWRVWSEWCDKLGLSPSQSVPDIAKIAQFLTERFTTGLSYNRLNVYRSMFSAFYPKVGGLSIGTQDIIVRVMKAAYKIRPPKPRYTTTWDVEVVLRGWDKPNVELTVYELSIKTFTLIAISTLGRGDDIRHLSRRNFNLERNQEGEPLFLELDRLKLPKQQRSGPLKPMRILAVSGSNNLCPVKTCLFYMDKTLPNVGDSMSELFVTSTKPYRGIAAGTAARWLLLSMTRGGIDTSQFKAHSLCGAAASGKVGKGASWQDILSGGRWANVSTFKKFYLRNVPQGQIPILQSGSVRSGL